MENKTDLVLIAEAVSLMDTPTEYGSLTVLARFAKKALDNKLTDVDREILTAFAKST